VWGEGFDVETLVRAQLDDPASARIIHMLTHLARSAGISESVIEALRHRQIPTFIALDEQCVSEIGQSLYETRRVSSHL
jgi:hypothetical protein